jgi:DNA-binding Xre family transcriptional regulator
MMYYWYHLDEDAAEGAAVKTLRAWRAERLLSSRRLAELAGASNKTIVQLENGRQTASFVTIEKICRVLDVEPRDVIEFAHAINERAGITAVEEPGDAEIRPRPTHVFCVSGATVFHTLTRRLLDTERYGITATIGVPVSSAQIACLAPDVVVLDLDTGSTGPTLVRDLLDDLQREAATSPIPIVVTGRNRQKLNDVAASLGQPDRPAVIVAPITPDLGELLSTLESLAIPEQLAATGTPRT